MCRQHSIGQLSPRYHLVDVIFQLRLALPAGQEEAQQRQVCALAVWLSTLAPAEV